MFKMDQTCSNLIKLYQMWFKWIKLIQNRSNFHIKVFFGHGRAINILGHGRVINIFGRERAINIFGYWKAINIIGCGIKVLLVIEGP